MNSEMVNRFIDFIVARHKVYIAKTDGKQRPWTDDSILQRYRFCNVFRELDAVTQWISKEWRGPASEDPDLWFGMVVARLFNYPDTLQYLGYPVPFNARRVAGTLHDLRNRGLQIFNGAYMVRANAGTEKGQYLVDEVLTPLWKKREFYRPRKGDTLASFAERLQRANGFKGFMTGQIVADIKYAHGPLVVADDWATWAISGPGSRRGMNRVMGRDINHPTKEALWLERVHELQSIVTPKLNKLKYSEPIHAQDVQNCLCEFDKYERVRLGQGRPRSKYDGVTNSKE